MSEIKLYGIEGNKLTLEIGRYLTMMRVDFQFEDLTENEALQTELVKRSGGDLRLVWIDHQGEKRLISSLAEMCQYLNEMNKENDTKMETEC